MIIKQGSKYILKSHKGKTLGRYPTLTLAKNRERQINFFKQLKGGI